MTASERPPFVSVYAAAVEEMARLNAEEKGWDSVDPVPVSPNPNPRPTAALPLAECVHCGAEIDSGEECRRCELDGYR